MGCRRASRPFSEYRPAILKIRKTGPRDAALMTGSRGKAPSMKAGQVGTKRICIPAETWIMIGRKREAICGEGG